MGGKYQRLFLESGVRSLYGRDDVLALSLVIAVLFYDHLHPLGVQPHKLLRVLDVDGDRGQFNVPLAEEIPGAKLGLHFGLLKEATPHADAAQSALLAKFFDEVGAGPPLYQADLPANVCEVRVHRVLDILKRGLDPLIRGVPALAEGDADILLLHRGGDTELRLCNLRHVDLILL